MQYQDALAYLYSFSDFERTGRFARDPEGNLRRMGMLLAELGMPHLAYSTTHIAGTKGKGSTAVLIAACLTASGVRTGLYTQPDLHTFRERIQIDGVPISEAEVAELVPTLQAAIGRLAPADAAQIITYEAGTALAFLAFARRGVRHAVIEVGLGGRLDATNVITPLVGVITSISLDHTAILGDTIAAIAGEKAGIIKPGMVIVTSAQNPDAVGVIRATCEARGASLTRVGPAGSGCAYTYDAPALPHRIATPADLVPPPFTVHTPTGDRELHIALLGAHQRENATAALAALDALRAVSAVGVTAAGMQQGMFAARWPARLDVVGARPWLVVDAAHNADSLAKALSALTENFVFDQLVIVFGTMGDKDVAGMAGVLGTHAARVRAIITTQGNTPRALPADQLASRLAPAIAAPIHVIPSAGAALTEALRQASPDDLVCLVGSVALAGEGLRWITAHRPSALTAHIMIAGNDHG